MASLEELQLNKNLYKETVQEDLLLPGDLSDTVFSDGGNTFGETSSESLTSGELAGNLILVDGFIRSKNFATGSAGWTIDVDGSVEFNDGTFRGTLLAGELHIPDEDTTANSFHVNTSGDTWWGATETDFDSSNDNAQAYILKTGCLN